VFKPEKPNQVAAQCGKKQSPAGQRQNMPAREGKPDVLSWLRSIASILFRSFHNYLLPKTFYTH
jgi:hypothetical protein